MSTKNTKPAVAPQVTECLDMATKHAQDGLPTQGSSTASAKLNTSVTAFQEDGTGKTTKSTYTASVTVGQASSSEDAAAPCACGCADQSCCCCAKKAPAAPAPSSEKKSS
jgi:hypothetical protein